MTEPRRTKNPWIGVQQSVLRFNAWRDGYRCGHSDAEMDERDKVVNMTTDLTISLHNEIDQLETRIANLVEKNDAQVKIIETLNADVIKQEGFTSTYRKENYTLRGQVMDLRREIRRQEAEMEESVESFIDNEAASFKAGHQAGVDACVSDMVVFAQSTGSTVKFVTAEQYATLLKISNELSVVDDKLVDVGSVVEEHVLLFNETLGDIECPPR